MKTLFISALILISTPITRLNAFIVTSESYNNEQCLLTLDKPRGAVKDSVDFFQECSVQQDSAGYYRVIQGEHEGWVKHDNVIPRYLDEDNNPIWNW